MISTAIRPQRDAVDTSGSKCRAWEFDYHLATFYIQESDTGYVIIEETRPRGGWRSVRPERRQMILEEFERVKVKKHM